MRKEYDFSQGKRVALIPSKGKTRITIYPDDEILDKFREQVEIAGMGYQTLIDEVLKKNMKLSNKDREQLKGHLKSIAQILYQNTPSDKLKTFEEITTTLREQIEEEILPEIAQFFFGIQPNEKRKICTH